MIFDCYLGKVSLLEADTKQAQYLINNGVYIGEDEVKRCVKLLQGRSNPVMIDGGANHGLFGFSMRKKIPDLVVHAIEAQPTIYELICETVKLNSFENYTVYNKAISDNPGSIDVPVYDYNKRGSFGSVELLKTSNDVGQKPTGTVPVDILRIDDMNLDRVDFIKFDVEGMEIHALRGSIETIRKHKPVMYIEYKKVGKNNLQKYFDNELSGLYNFKWEGADVICTAK